MSSEPTKFEWDPVKAASNQEKHGVSFVEAATVFFDPLSITVSDPVHSVDEQRFVITGNVLSAARARCGACGPWC